MKIYLLFFLIPLNVYAQDTLQNTAKAKRFTAGLHISPEIVLSSISSSIYINETSEPTFGLSSGLTGDYMINSRFSIRGDLGYSLKKNSVKLNGLAFETDFDPVTGLQISESRMETKYIYGEIFLQLAGVYATKSRKLYCTAGFEVLSIFKKSSTKKTIFGNGSESKTEGIYDGGFNYGPFISIGYNFYSKNRKILSVEPSFKTYINDYGARTLTTFNVSSFGLKTTFWF